MIRRSRAQSSSLFLMELILAILFFSITSAVCVQFFVKSHLLSRDSNALNHAVNICAGVAETVSAAESIQDAAGLLKELFPDSAFPDGDSMDTRTDAETAVYYDSDFAVCKQADASYILFLQLSQSGQLLNASMSVTGAGTDSGAGVIYTLTARHHIPRRTDYEER